MVRPESLHSGPVAGAEPAVAPGSNGSAPEEMDLGAVERGLLEKALERSRGNKSKAARMLGLTRAQLYWRMEKYGLR
jgi:DNA-binding protein Fis